jgi:hypothetical protein
MTDFDRIAYWKHRINEHINSLFRDTSDALKKIRDEAKGIGANEEEIERAVKTIGDGYDMLKFCCIDKVKDIKEVSHE